MQFVLLHHNVSALIASPLDCLDRPHSNQFTLAIEQGQNPFPISRETVATMLLLQVGDITGRTDKHLLDDISG